MTRILLMVESLPFSFSSDQEYHCFPTQSPPPIYRKQEELCIPTSGLSVRHRSNHVLATAARLGNVSR